MFKDHKTEYFQLTEEENRGYCRGWQRQPRLSELYHPDKINYATFGGACPMYYTRGSQIKGRTSVGEAFHDDEKVLSREGGISGDGKALREEITSFIHNPQEK